MSQMLNEPQLEESLFQPNSVRIQHWLPWLRMFRTFRMAIDYRRMLIAIVAVFLWVQGAQLIHYWLGAESPVPAVSPQEQVLLSSLQDLLLLEGHMLPQQGNLSAFLHKPIQTVAVAFSRPSVVLWPVQRMALSARDVLFSSRGDLQWFEAVFTTFWGLLVCGFFGGAISRMAAVDFAGRGELSVVQALKFSSRSLLSYLGAPLIPVFGLLILWVPNLLAGLLLKVPVVGETVVGVLWIIAYVFGVLMALIVFGVVAGWPIMIAAISTEASDAFDGLSRSYSYLFNQLWSALLLVVFIMFYGSAALFLVQGVMNLAMDLTVTSMQSVSGDLSETGLSVPSLTDPALLNTRVLQPSDDYWFSKSLLSFWGDVLRAVPAAFTFSFFWTAVTIAYFMLRLRDDGTPLYLVGGMPEDDYGDTLPVVGIPATERRDKPSEGDAAGSAEAQA